jgi:hypothetical protein
MDKKQLIFHTKPIWVVISHILKSANSSEDENYNFTLNAIKELSKPCVLGFDAAVCVAFDGDINAPLSLELSKSEKPVCFRIEESFVYGMWDLIKEVKNKFDEETAIKFMMSDFSDELRHMNSGTTEPLQLIERYGAAAGHVELALELFNKERIAYWAIRPDSYDGLTYVTSFYRRNWERPYSLNELDFFDSLLAFLSRAYSLSSSPDTWVSILACDLGVVHDTKIRMWEAYHYSLKTSQDRELLAYINEDLENNSVYIHEDTVSDINHEIMKLQLPNTISKPFIMIISYHISNYVPSFDSVWKR